jgi:hypothetical protein
MAKARTVMMTAHHATALATATIAAVLDLLVLLRRLATADCDIAALVEAARARRVEGRAG